MNNKKLVAGGNLREWKEVADEYIAECEAVNVTPTFEGLANWQRQN